MSSSVSVGAMCCKGSSLFRGLTADQDAFRCTHNVGFGHTTFAGSRMTAQDRAPGMIANKGIANRPAPGVEATKDQVARV
jgi:hypothetical protein